MPYMSQSHVPLARARAQLIIYTHARLRSHCRKAAKSVHKQSHNYTNKYRSNAAGRTGFAASVRGSASLVLHSKLVSFHNHDNLRPHTLDGRELAMTPPLIAAVWCVGHIRTQNAFGHGWMCGCCGCCWLVCVCRTIAIACAAVAADRDRESTTQVYIAEAVLE